eukprot:Skav201130  [mRNA]  locus=scaffold4373:194633:196390:+ [translate_table: standard]
MDVLALWPRPGYLGKLRRKASTLQSSCWELSWKRKCVFDWAGQSYCWLAFFSDPFRIGCWVCHRAGGKCQHSKFQVQSHNAVQVSNLIAHAKSKVHRDSVQKLLDSHALGRAANPRPDVEEADVGIASGLTDSVPRIDKWVSALDLLVARAGYQRQRNHVECQSIGSALVPGRDSCPRVVKQMYECLRSQLDATDLQYMKTAVKSSIALDKGGDHLVVYARCLVPEGVYDFFVGLDDNATPDDSQPDASRAVLRSLKNVLQRACTVRQASRRVESIYSGPDDAVCEQTFSHFCRSVVSLVADGGPNEQRALYEASPLATTLSDCAVQDVLFPEAALISRDRAHRCRSIDKGFWRTLPSVFQDFLAKLITGERSFAKMVATSSKFQRLFVQKQKDSKESSEDGPGFAKLLKNLSFADHRFDSRKKPLFRLFKLLPVAISCLEAIAADPVSSAFDVEDAKWAASLLQDFEGDAGYNRVVGAAVAADCLLLAWPFLKVSDRDAGDFALVAPAAAECLQNLKHMLVDGGLWLPQAKDTLTHSVLHAIHSRIIFVGKGGDKARAIPIRWPAPNTEARREPVRLAKQLLES